MKMGLGMEGIGMGMAVLETTAGEDCLERGMIKEAGQVMVAVEWVTEMTQGGGVEEVEKMGGDRESVGLRYVHQHCMSKGNDT